MRTAAVLLASTSTAQCSAGATLPPAAATHPHSYASYARCPPLQEPVSAGRKGRGVAAGC